MVGQERPFWVGFLLSVVTLTFYHFWWHYLTHDEVCRQIGRPNQEKPLWFGYIAVNIVSMILVVGAFAALIAGLGPEAFDGTLDEEQVAERMIENGGTALALLLLGMLVSLAAPVLLLIFAHKQAKALTEAFHAYGQQTHVSSGPFLGLYIGGVLGSLVLFGIGLILMPIAYYTLQDPYNRFWRLVQYGAERQPTYGHAPAPPQGVGVGGPPPYDRFRYAGAEARHEAPPSGVQPGMQPGSRSGMHPAGPDDRPAPNLVEQPFRCPRCHTHVTARGEASMPVQVQCPSCGQSGEVTLGRA